MPRISGHIPLLTDLRVCMSATEKLAVGVFLAGMIAFIIWVVVWILRK